MSLGFCCAMLMQRAVHSRLTCTVNRQTQGVAATLRKLHGSYGTVTNTRSLATRAGPGAATDSLHVAFSAIAEQHVLRSAVDFYNNPKVRSVQRLCPRRNDSYVALRLTPGPGPDSDLRATYAPEPAVTRPETNELT